MSAVHNRFRFISPRKDKKVIEYYTVLKRMNNKLELISSRHTSERRKKSQTANLQKLTVEKLRVKNAFPHLYGNLL